MTDDSERQREHQLAQSRSSQSLERTGARRAPSVARSTHGSRSDTGRGRRAPRSRRGRVDSARAYEKAARERLKRFRQGTALAIAITGLALLLWGVPEATGQDPLAATSASLEPVIPEPGTSEATTSAAMPPESVTPGTASTAEPTPAATTAEATTPEIGADVETAAAAAPQQQGGVVDTVANAAGQAVREATGTLRELFLQTAGLLPKILIALGILITAWIVSRLAGPLFARTLSGWENAGAAGTLAAVLIWLLALATALSVLAGDVRALIGSVGLLGLALSWALQAPIESFSAYLLNSFKGYYRVGDRIAVGDVFGDVFRIDLLTTTVWEAGGPDKPVQGAQPTGALTTFPNSEVLRSNIINYTRDFPYVWDEVVVGVANESDLPYAMDIARETAKQTVGAAMAGPIAHYRTLLQKARLAFDVADEPQIYLSLTDSWTNLTVRYLVGVRERRKWATRLIMALNEAMNAPEHGGRIIGSYPVTRVETRGDRAVAPPDPGPKETAD